MHHIALSYQAGGDFPRRHAGPELQYILATSPRSGSTYLATLLWRTGLLGAPMEYLNFEFSGGIVERLGGGDIVTYWRELRRRRTSPNGVFGWKVFLANYTKTMTDHPRLLEHIRCHKVIFLRRLDKVAQAVSHLRAVQTGSWFADTMTKAEPEYDFKRLLGFYSHAVLQDQRWEQVFGLTGADVLRLTYENATLDPDGTVREVCGFLGVEFDESAALSQVQLTKPQSDSVNRDWKARFKEDLERHQSNKRSSGPRGDGADTRSEMAA